MSPLHKLNETDAVTNTVNSPNFHYMKGSLKDAIQETVGAILLLTFQTEDDVQGKSIDPYCNVRKMSMHITDVQHLRMRTF